MTESLHALSGAYAIDALDDQERDLFERHLPGCLDCQREVASLREAAALMADVTAVTPPASLRASVLSGITMIRPLPPETVARGELAEEEAPTPALATVTPMRPRRRRIATLVAAAAAVVAVAAGSVYQPWQDSNPAGPTLSAADQVLAASDAKRVSIDFKDGSSATLVRSPSEGRAVLLTRAMAAPPEGKAFELWLRNEAGVMKPAGMMYTAGDHKVLLKGDATKATAVGITVEPKSGSTSPSSAPIAMFELGEGNA